ncbi:MAG: ABC transporter permease subunit [Planctomycetota bacterium]|jgi:ABC-type transport system involved in multi-copper enzyme maturation permease subunit
MTTALVNLVRHFASLSWLTGPIFDKELRVSSRRRRNYVLRFVYLALLTTFLALLWLEVVRYHGSFVHRTARMAEAGKAIITFIVWFQFCATQAVAVIILSTSISDEIYNRTLGLLMTTPVNSFQIVMGKLFSRLLQLILLLAISLPLLAIVRVFGGVPWAYVISSLCITLTTIIFVGSLSLFFSIFTRRAYVVIILTALTLGLLFALIPFFTAMIWHTANLRHTVSDRTLLTLFLHLNPYGTMAFNTERLFNPRGGAGIPLLFWQVHCGIMLAASAFVLSLCVGLVRRVALRQATGQLDTSRHKKPSRKSDSAQTALPDESAAPVRRVNGAPAIWKELRAPILRRHKIAAFIAIAVAIVLLFVSYVLWEEEGDLNDEEVHMMYATVFIAAGMLFTIVIPATCITSEKESRSWPLLLATTLSDSQILFGKFVGVVRRCLPIWLFLFGHLLLFALIGYIHPLAIGQMAILVAWIITFLSCTGLYFSSRFKRTTTAVIMNFALAAVIWALVPILLFLVTEVFHADDGFAEAYMDTNPFVHAIVVMDGTANSGNLSSYHWVALHSLDISESTYWMFSCMLGYMGVGLIFAWLAKRRLRRNIF